MNNALGRAARILSVPIALVAIWTLLTLSYQSIFFPSPIRIAASFVDWLPAGISAHLLPSLSRLVAGYSVAIAIGVCCGVAVGRSRVLYRMFMPTIDFVRSIPKPVFIAPLVLMFGLGSVSRVAIVALGSMWPVLLATIDGARGRDPRYDDIARVFKISGIRRIFRVEIPAASPHILAGVRVGLSLAVFMLLVGEMYAATNGLGYYILDSQRSFDLPGMWVGTVVAGVFGFLLSYALEAFERRVLFWSLDDFGARAATEAREEQLAAAP